MKQNQNLMNKIKKKINQENNYPSTIRIKFEIKIK